jgi:hypothetical protein
MAALLTLGAASAETLPGPCEDLARKTEETFRKMDESIKLKAGMLLGEMEAAKGALQGCIDRNEAISTQMALVWLLGDACLLSMLPIFYFHQRRMKRAVVFLSGLQAAKGPTHASRYVPSRALYLWGMGLITTGFIGLNLIALFL